MSGKQMVYWDSCIFIAWLSNEHSNPVEMQAIQDQVHKFDQKQLDITTSTITIAEVLACRLPPNAQEYIKLLRRKTNFHLEDVTFPIIEKAHTIRNFYAEHPGPEGLLTLSTPDAIHLATAIDTECQVLYTFDGATKLARPRPLLPLNGTMIAGRYYLRIERPQPDYIDTPMFGGLRTP